MEDVFQFGTNGTRHFAVVAESDNSFVGREVCSFIVSMLFSSDVANFESLQMFVVTLTICFIWT
jgi:hypothetical protein